MTRDTKEFRRTILLLTAAASFFYAAAAFSVFAFRHPHLTDTQRAGHFFDALAWRTIKEQGK